MTELGRVAVGGVEHLKKHVPVPQFDTTERDVVLDKSRLAGDRALKADDLFDGGAYEGWVLNQAPPLTLVTEQQGEAVAYERPCRLVSRDEAKSGTC